MLNRTVWNFCGVKVRKNNTQHNHGPKSKKSKTQSIAQNCAEKYVTPFLGQSSIFLNFILISLAVKKLISKNFSGISLKKRIKDGSKICRKLSPTVPRRLTYTGDKG